MLAFAATCSAADPPRDLARRVAEREGISEAERSRYTYQQWLTVEEFDRRGNKGGIYQERREVIFLENNDRVERFVSRPVSTLKFLRMTEEDFRDMRDIQPILFTRERLGFYESQYKGEEKIDGIDCWILQVRPKQILDGMRMFEGTLWVDQSDLSVIRTEGRAVPQIRSTRPGNENLFAFFTTVRQKMGDYWFPVLTFADDTLDFNNGPLRIRFTIRYRDYKRFGAQSTITPSEN